jgi:hypothetical protein
MPLIKAIRPAYAETKEILLDKDQVFHAGELCINKQNIHLFLTDFSISSGLGGIPKPVQTLDMAITHNGDAITHNGNIVYTY